MTAGVTAVVILVAVPYIRWGVAPVVAAYELGRLAERLRHARARDTRPG